MFGKKTLKKRVLLIDDEPDFTYMMKLNLEKTGRYEVCEENKAIEAFETAKRFKPDLILLDIIMPRMSGLEVLDVIRKNEKERGVDPKNGVKIIMVSGMKESWMNDAFRDGCNDYIVKPYDLDFLLAKVSSMTGAEE